MSLLNIIIVNWNAGNKLLDCIQSVLKSNLDQENYSINIVDNDSSDNSLKLVENLSANIHIVSLKENIGFGSACNIILNKISPEYVLFLNPDVVLLPDTLEKSVEFLDKNREIDVLGVRNYDSNGNVARSCSRYPSLGRFVKEILGLSKVLPKVFHGNIMTDWNHLESKEVDHVIGAYMLVRYSALKNVNFFDDDYFLYLEDIDLSYRIKKSGGKIFYNSDISVIHEGGGTTKKIRAQSLYYSMQSRVIYSKKHFKPFFTFIIIILSVTFEPLLRVFKIIITLNYQDFIPVVSAYIKYCKWLFFQNIN